MTKQTLEHHNFETAKEVRDFLNAYTDSELDTMYVEEDRVIVEVIEETLSDNSTVRNIVFLMPYPIYEEQI